MRYGRAVSVFAISAAVIGLTAATPQAGAEPPKNCVVPDDRELSEQWIASDAAQQTMATLRESLSARFGESSKTSPETPLMNGLIGIVTDHRTQQVVVVVDPAMVDESGLQNDLRGLAKAQVGVRVQAGCHSAAELLDAAKTIRDRAWHPRVGQATYASALDARTSRYEITFGTKDWEVGDALKADLGDRVTVDYGEVGRADRADDGMPHWGGAGIGLVGGGNICSSGFTVDTRTAGKAMMTAGHCFNNGQRIESGDEPYGTAQGKVGYPTWDMMLINASNQNYDDDIYHNPFRAENSPLDVAGGAEPAMGTSLCISGMVSKAVCGNTVDHLSAQLCDPDGCTPNLYRTTRASGTACRGGDSGAPAYRGTSPAIVYGMHIGHVGLKCLGEKRSSIQSHLGVTVASQP